MALRARFDDLTPGREASFEFFDPGEVVTATEPADVIPALDRVEDLSRQGWWMAGFVAYDAAPGLDPGLVVPGPVIAGGAVPLVWFGAFERRVAAAPLSVPERDERAYELEPWESEASAGEHAAAVRTIREHIAAGDTYQVNLTYRMRSMLTGDRFGFYRDLTLAQRGGYGAYLDTGGLVVASASPERFFRIDGRHIDVKPMKGTIRRGRWSAEDEEFRDRLARSEKDRAENIMIVDLLRNDVGRVARFGSVVPTRLLDVERYETLWQLTSEVEAELEAGIRFSDVVAALFPSGSVTGAPKMATMGIIRSLETSPRRLYCGAIGYLAPRKANAGLQASFSVAIRTAVVDANSGAVEYGVGGGITWDSDPAAEYAEAALKADVLSVLPRPKKLLETMRWEADHGYRLAERHLDRLSASAEYFGFDCDLEAVREGLVAAAGDLDGDRMVRLTLDRSGEIDVGPGDEPGRFGKPGDRIDPVTVALSTEPVDSSDVMLFHKTTDRDPYDRRAANRPDVDDVLLVNERGDVTESTIANLAAQIEGAWLTPPLESGCLPGTYRAELLATGVIEERTLTEEDVRGADELAILNSVRGWRAARLVD